MKVYEAIDRAKQGGCAANVANDVLKSALARLEKQIADKAEVGEARIDDETVLLACGGGVADGYDDMYNSYLKREASCVCEAWENYGNYDTLFVMRYGELCKEILRKREPKRYS